MTVETPALVALLCVFVGPLVFHLVLVLRSITPRRCRPGTGEHCAHRKQGRTRTHTCVRPCGHDGEHMCECSSRWP